MNMTRMAVTKTLDDTKIELFHIEDDGNQSYLVSVSLRNKAYATKHHEENNYFPLEHEYFESYKLAKFQYIYYLQKFM